MHRGMQCMTCCWAKTAVLSWAGVHSLDASSLHVTDLEGVQEKRMVRGFVYYACPEGKAVIHTAA